MRANRSRKTAANRRIRQLHQRRRRRLNPLFPRKLRLLRQPLFQRLRRPQQAVRSRIRTSCVVKCVRPKQRKHVPDAARRFIARSNARRRIGKFTKWIARSHKHKLNSFQQGDEQNGKCEKRREQKFWISLKCATTMFAHSPSEECQCQWSL